MSLDLTEYFNLGIESTNQPVEDAGLINVFRTPVDTSSKNLNRITFKVPKTGMLTGDSMITLQMVLSDTTATASNATVNLVNGAVGAIKRTKILIDNKTLVDLERPGLPEVVKLYSRNTQVELSEKQYKLMGNQFRTKIDEDGSENFDTKNTRILTKEGTNNVSIPKNIILHENNSKVYGIPLKYLGADFLEAASLPVFLLGNREMIIEIEFHSDCREYAVDVTGAALTANQIEINVANAELVSTHIMLPSAVEAQEIANLRRQPAQYPLLDTYLVKGVVDTSSTTIGTEKDETYRINFQNREVHNLLMASVAPVPTSKRITANQFATSMGDEKLQLKINGLNLFDRPITSQPLIYQLTTYSEDGRTLKVPRTAWSVDNNTELAMNAPTYNTDLYNDYRGGFHYVKVDFSNSNAGVFGSGTIMKTAAEIDYNITPRVGANPNQTVKNDMLFYPTISKLLSIGANEVNISY